MSTRLTQPLDAEEAQLADGLARLGDALPPPALDSRIRAEAHTALRRRPLRRWGGALAAVLALGVGIKMSLSPVPLEPGILPADSAVGEQNARSPVVFDQADRSQSAEANAASGSVAQKPSQAEPAPPQEVSASRARADIQSAPMVQRRNEQPATAAPAAMSDAPQATRAMESAAAPAPASPPAQAFPSAPLRATKEGARSPVGRSELSSPPSIAPAPAPPAAPASNEARAQAKQQEKRKAAEFDKAAEVQSFAPDAKLARQTGDSEGEQRAPLDDLINQARQLKSSGDDEKLRRVLALIERDYPDTELPQDVQAMLDAERQSR